MEKPLIYITRKIPQEILAPHEASFTFKMWEEENTPVPREVFLKETKQADGIVCMLTERIDKELLENTHHLKIIANMAVGYDNIDIEVAKKHNIIVTNTPDVLTETTADLTFALLMATARRMTEASDYIREDKWGHWSPFLLAGTDIHHKKLGIVGMGRIGEAVAKRAKGFGMSILYNNRTRKYEKEKELNAVYTEFDNLLSEADFIISLVPLTNRTKHLFNEQAFQKMKKSAIFINVSRGGTMDEKALVNALKSQEITAAGLDVFEDEPIPSDHPLVRLDNAICLPHIGSASIETRKAMLHLCMENVVSFFDGNGPKTPVFE
ncbi:MAG TPA: D-glycerate dehydrogenase [Virgibacillus sp.]|nr:D-glycerate dehydrogenase [Virgibacillus sp.]HLR67876.1 D-glycerate dehydrogenase [Virgibacillus sp.]